MASMTVRAEQCKPVTVTLESPGATGYEWKLDPNESRVRVLSHEIAANTQAFGAASTEVFVLEPLEAGSYSVRFLLARPWEDTPEEERVVHLTCEAASPEEKGGA